MKEYTFTAKLEQGDGGGAFVRFPYDVKKEFGKGRVPINCTIDGEPYRGTMVRYGTPYHMLLVLKAIREKIGKQAGDTVNIWLAEDKEERKMEVPADFAKVLTKNKLSASFDKLSYTHQREYITWIESAKKPETRIARMEKAVTMIKAKKHL